MKAHMDVVSRSCGTVDGMGKVKFAKMVKLFRTRELLAIYLDH